jgi:hypothetical protein
MNTLEHLELNRKLDPVSKKGFKIKLKKSIVEPEKESFVQQKHLKIVDKTKKSHIDRESILERLMKTSRIETLLLDKSPVVREKEIIPLTISEYEKEKMDYEQFSKTFLETEKEFHPELKEKGRMEEEKEKEMIEMEETGEEKETIEQEPEKPPKKQRKTRKLKEPTALTEEPVVSNYLQVKIGNKILQERLPKNEKIIMKTSPYYMNNRKLFIQKLATIFTPYREKIQSNEAAISCEEIYKEKVDRELLTHQEVVRDYLNLYTPYRGLLLYHGLGSGKTCSSIAIAEGMKSEKRIVLMTPASLKMNFFSELKKCGDHIYRKNQFWEFISIEGQNQMVSVLSQALSLSPEYIRSRGGAWMVDVTKPPNFSQLSTNDQKNVDDQINTMIRAKYLDINYNGLNNKKMEELGKGNKNPFDHSVVIIDEAHNLVSRIGNKLKSKKSIAYRIYQWLLDATDVRVVLLTGTPIINYPHEIGVLYNILRGHIKTWNFQLSPTTSEKINRDIILEKFQKAGLNTYDYVEYSGDNLNITRNPFGFINVIQNKKKGGFTKETENQEDKKEKSKTKKNQNLSLSKTKKSRENENSQELEPEFIKESNSIFTKPYEGGSSEVFDDYKGVVLDVTGNISDNDFQKRVTDILKPIATIVGKPSITSHKCLPDDPKKFIEMFINPNGEVINVDLFKRRILGLTSYFRSAQEKLLPSFVKTEDGETYHKVYVEMSDHQFGIYDEIRNKEREQEKQNKKASRKKEKMASQTEVIDDKISSTYRIFSRAACNFAFPTEIERPMPPKTKEGSVDENVFNGFTSNELKNSDDYFEEEQDVEGEYVQSKDVQSKDVQGKKTKEIDNETIDDKEIVSYQTQIENALKKMEYNELEPRENNYLLPEGLALYSPKFLKILENIKDPENKGLHLLYSQFRTIEGIGILKLILEANGYAHFKIQKKGEEWEIVEEPENENKPKFILYTGTENAEEKEILRNIYISAWELVPQGIVSVLRKKSSDETKNFMGEVIQLMMITSSGAEGINLRNCRYVHIVEPYWNGARLQQVIGRARRICSHQDLPEELRTVKVFVYISVIPKKLLIDKQNEKIREIREFDHSKKDTNIPFTTDQTLFEIAEIKDGINTQILKAIKETSIDCSLYNNNPDEPLTCYGFGLVKENQFSSYPRLETDLSEKVITTQAPKISWKGVEIEDPNTGIKYSMNTKTREIYDLESYKKSILTGSELILVGKLVEKKVDGKKIYVIEKQK